VLPPRAAHVRAEGQLDCASWCSVGPIGWSGLRREGREGGQLGQTGPISLGTKEKDFLFTPRFSKRRGYLQAQTGEEPNTQASNTKHGAQFIVNSI